MGFYTLSVVKNIDVNIGRRCNLRCVFCLDGRISSKQRQWVGLPEAKQELRRGWEDGCRSMGLLGGEPTVYPYVMELLEYARELGFVRLALYTNGLRLGDATFCDGLVDAGVTRLGISIHGHRAELEDRITTREGSFEAKLAGIRRLLAHKRRGRLAHGLAVNPVITRLNLPYLLPIFRFFARLGVDDFRFNFVRAIGRAEGSRALTPRYRDAARACVELIVENERRWHRSLSFGDFPFCVWPWEVLGSEVLRRRYIGEFHDLVTDVSLFEAPSEDTGDLDRFNWADRRKARLKQKFDACEGCAFYDDCEGVYRCYSELYGIGEFGAVLASGVRRKRSSGPSR
jgi:MoaA/NifB/PqqE/SkfB family radical SAM enzyme